MIRRLRALRGQPRFPMAIVGHGRVHYEHLPGGSRRSLLTFVTVTPAQWGLLLVRDACGRRRTLYTPDPDCTEMFVPNALALDLAFDVFSAKFPCWNRGWSIT